MFARKARRAWELAERIDQPTTVRPGDLELSPGRAMLAEAVVRSVMRRRSLARHGLLRGGGEGWLRRAPTQKRPDVASGPPRSRVRWSAHRTTGRGPARARTTIDHDIVVCVMATLTTGEPSLVRDGERAFRSSIAMAETCRVRLGDIRQRLFGHGTGRRRRAVAFALAAGKRGVLATASRVAPAFGVTDIAFALRSSRRAAPWRRAAHERSNGRRLAGACRCPREGSNNF